MKKRFLIGLIVLGVVSGYAQQNISPATFKPYTIYFSLDEDYNIGGEAKAFLLDAIKNNQFVGLAEVHQSQQLSSFTISFLDLLKEKKFNKFAIELGPISAQIVQEQSEIPEETINNLRRINRKYGKKKFPKIPLIFVDKVEDAKFIQQASRLNYDIWGLDQEFIYSYEMHLDRIYSLIKEKSNEINQRYNECKEILQKSIFKSKVSGQTKNCWLQNEVSLQNFFKSIEDKLEVKPIVDALRNSWEIYCRNEQGLASNQLRADYMIANFENYFSNSQNDSKVFVKLGGIHLTHGKSVFGVNDVGSYLSNKGKKLNTGFLSIRHLRRFKNGKDLIGKKGWKNVELIMKLGKKEQWTLVDFRPIRQQLLENKITTDNQTYFEIMNYDLLLISPDDKISTLNY